MPGVTLAFFYTIGYLVIAGDLLSEIFQYIHYFTYGFAA
jgi:hypothetical protein